MTSHPLPKTSTGSQKQRKPTLFADRSLGHDVVAGLRRFGYNVKHMRDVYPDDGQNEADDDWIAYVAQQGWIILTQDVQIWQNNHERAAVEKYGARVFCLHKANLKRAEKGLVIGRHLFNILRRGQRQGACFWRLRPDNPIKYLL